MEAAIYSFSLRGAELAKRIEAVLSDLDYSVSNKTVAKYAEQANLAPMLPDHNAACGEDFARCQLLVFVGAVGIAVRTIAPYIKSKLYAKYQRAANNCTLYCSVHIERHTYLHRFC